MLRRSLGNHLSHAVIPTSRNKLMNTVSDTCKGLLTCSTHHNWDCTKVQRICSNDNNSNTSSSCSCSCIIHRHGLQILKSSFSSQIATSELSPIILIAYFHISDSPIMGGCSNIFSLLRSMQVINPSWTACDSSSTVYNQLQDIQPMLLVTANTTERRIGSKIGNLA